MRGRLPRLAMLALAVLCLALPSYVGAQGSGFGWQPEELNWYGISQRRINDVRADAGQPLLIADDYLWGLTRERARDMLERNYLSHVTPEGLDAGAYMRDAKVRYDQWVEFRAQDTSGRPQDVVTWEIIEGLLNDPAARAVIVSDFDQFGVAVAEGNGRRVFVIMLAKSAPPPTPIAVATAPAQPARAPQSIIEIITAAAQRYGVDPAYLIRVARCESSLNPRAYNPAGPYIGLFQFAPSTFHSYGGSDIYSPYDQADVAARMFSRGLASHWPVCGRR